MSGTLYIARKLWNFACHSDVEMVAQLQIQIMRNHGRCAHNDRLQVLLLL